MPRTSSEMKLQSEADANVSCMNTKHEESNPPRAPREHEYVSKNVTTPGFSFQIKSGNVPFLMEMSGNQKEIISDSENLKMISPS